MSERDDYADLDLPPEQTRSRIIVGAIVAAVIVLTVAALFPLLAWFVTARMKI